MPLINPGIHRNHCRSFGQRAHSIEDSEFAEHHDHSHQRWQDHHNPFADSDIDLEIGQVEHHNHLVDQGTGLETAG